jgi:hypothetical protein
MLGKDIEAGGAAPVLIGNSFTFGIPAGTGSLGPAEGGGGTYPYFSSTAFLTADSFGGGASAVVGFYAFSKGFWVLAISGCTTG